MHSMSTGWRSKASTQVLSSGFRIRAPPRRGARRDRDLRATDPAGGGCCCVGWMTVTDVDGFVHQFLAAASPEDVAAIGAENLTAAARALFALGASRRAGQAVVRVANPTQLQDGWESPHTVVEIVTD